MPPRYPLSVLHEGRRLARDRAEVLAAQAVLARTEAERHESEVRQQIESIRQASTATAPARILRREHDTATAAELQMAEGHRQLMQLQLERRTEELRQARLMVEKTRGACENARQGVVRAGQELTLVDKHHDRFCELAEKVSEARTEEEAAENWISRDCAFKLGNP